MFFFRIICILLSIIPLTSAVLEDDILYDIKWQSESITPTDSENTFLFSSKRKEKFACTLPKPETTVPNTPETVLFSDVEPYLKNLHSQKPCTYRLDPYWTYELCHGIHIRQYHETVSPAKKTVSQEYFLGYYESLQQNIITTADNQQALKIHYKTINHRQVPMLSIRYTSGTNCDINSNNPRETTVYYVCDEKGPDGIISFQEVSSCQYEIIVASSKLCDLPEFYLAESNRHTISCHPQENALQKPRSLAKLEKQHKSISKTGPGAQFTMTGADGTTFIISYEYMNEDDVKPTTPPPSTPPTDRTTFLKDFFSGQQCLTGGSGWWKYELCYGKHVIQYHDDNDKRTSIVLGKWKLENHIEWIKKNPKRKASGYIKERLYVPFYYSDGDLCELTNRPRVVEVKLKCTKRADASATPTMYLVEPDTCAYVLGVESPLFCNLNEYTDEHGIPNEEKLFNL